MNHEIALYTFSYRKWEGCRLNALFVSADEEWILSRDNEDDCIVVPYVQNVFKTDLCFKQLARDGYIEFTGFDVIFVDKTGGRAIWNQLIKSNFFKLDRLAKDSIISKHFKNGTNQIRRELL